MSADSGRKGGRARKGDAPWIPYEELDRILVFGEMVLCEGGGYSKVVYPSYRELARRFGVSHGLIGQYAKKHNCLRRRQQVQARAKAKADHARIERRAAAMAVSKERALRIVDRYLIGFEEALAEGRVRCDSPSDFNTMVRLKVFIEGGADAHQEVHALLSLEDLQARHRHMMQIVAASTPAMGGGVEHRGALPARDAVQRPPASAEVMEDAAELPRVPRGAAGKP